MAPSANASNHVAYSRSIFPYGNKNDAFDYTGLAKYLSIAEPHNVKGITKEEVKLLTHSDRERESVRYVVHNASGGTQKKTATMFGFRKMEEHSAHVEACISIAAEICSSISELSILQNQATCTLTTVVACKHN